MADHAKRRALVQHVMEGMTRSSARDGQKSIGPSEIGDPCGRCLGRALCRKYPELWWEPVEPDPDRFGVKTWMGTAAHEKLERDVRGYSEVLGQVVKEITLPIHDLPGYGMITGHCDLLAGDIILDYKTRDLEDIRALKLSGRPPQKELVQTNLYGHGARMRGITPEALCLFYIPRDSNHPEDIFPAFLEPSEAVVERALERLEKVWEVVRNGDGGTLKKHDACYVCVLRYKLPTR